MKRITSNDFSVNGLKQITFLEEFVYIHQYGSHDFSEHFKDYGFKKYDNRFLPPDFMDSETIYKRLTQQEKNDNDLEYQINLLENRFKIKITYEKL